MKKFLPAIFTLFFVIFLFLPSQKNAYAQSPTPADGSWVQDSEVTFVGKAAARSGQFLDWTLQKQNYSWAVFPNSQANPLMPFWVTIRNIAYAFIALFVLGTAFVLIITRGRNISARQIIPKFLAVILLITFSYALIQIIYQFTDVIQGFFLVSPDDPTQNISQKNLLSVAFNYKDFVGYRLVGMVNDESAFISLLLVKLTAITYYFMTMILLLRKIILWFFIVISPIFPLLILFYPIRNTAKIWIGEFFRWLLYAPIFAIFLSGLVSIWRAYIPLLGFSQFPFPGVGDPSKIVYPTAINILIGGPKQVLSLNNSVNMNDTFAQYVVALLMLWVVILLPFILLQIFLDYFMSFSFSENNIVKKVVTGYSSVFNKGIPPSPPPPLPSSKTPAGMAKALPFSEKFSIPAQKQTQIPINTSVQANSEIMHLTNLSVPTMRDIAKYETNMLSSNVLKRQEVSKVHDTLEKIASPKSVASPQTQQQYQQIRQKLVQEKQKGNPLAASILSAAGNISKEKRQKFAPSVAPSDLFEKAMYEAASQTTQLPSVNRVQTVSLDDYESVKKMWQENYQKLEPPKEIQGEEVDRKVWIQNDIDKINKAIELLTATEPTKVNEGMEMVGNILPFLLIGGFSRTEVVAYLKAKLEAGKSVLSEIKGKEEEESTTIDVTAKKEEKPKEMHLEEKQPLEPSKEQVQNIENKIEQVNHE
ncbi:MAG: hypothetical protein M1524_02780 [Patescibacteria group bacterium]|nr:hypothetical protein [Patescibacteria group bacterium]